MNILRKTAGPVLFSALFLLVQTGRVTPVSLERQAPDTIEAEIKGEVKNPGVYTVKNGSDIEDLIAAAGGETEAADLSPIALIDELYPGQVIVIGKKEMDGTSARISINTASLEQLQMLPGVGPAMAQRIIDYRSEKSFESLEDLMEVKGIGEKTFEKLKDLIAL